MIIQEPYLKYIKIQLKGIFPYFLVFFTLLLINFFFNLYSRWDGVSLVVKMYLFAFAFFFIYNLATDVPDDMRWEYASHGNLGKLVFVAETRIFPFFFIYLLAVLYSIVENAGSGGWPQDALSNLFDDSNTNLVMYSLLFYYVLRIKKRPYLTVPLFLAVAYLYYSINVAFYSYVFAGRIIILYKLAKVACILFFMIWNFSFTPRRLFIFLSLSFTISIFINTLIMSTYYLEYTWYPSGRSRLNIGLKLAKYGIPVSSVELMEIAFSLKDIDLVENTYELIQHKGGTLMIEDEKWLDLLTGGSAEVAERVASIMLKEGITVPFEDVVEFCRRLSYNPDTRLADADNLARLCAKSLKSEEDINLIILDLEKVNEPYLVWSIKLLGETGSCNAIRILLNYLGINNSAVSQAAFHSLTALTGFNPTKEQKMPYNSVDSLIEFKEIYLQNCKVN